MTIATSKSMLTVAAAGLLALASFGCDEPDTIERADDGASESGDESPMMMEIDEADIIEQAQRYSTDLVRVSDGPEQEETHADAAAVQVWSSAAAVDDFLSIDPDDPTQQLSFAPGTFFVKEHLDASGATRGLTLMYKAEPGYDPEGGDWFWARIDGDTVSDSGRVGWCSGCHAAAHNSDFVIGFGKSP